MPELLAPALTRTGGLRSNLTVRERRTASSSATGILRERLADVLTDAHRAAVLRLLGYRVNVEVVAP